MLDSWLNSICLLSSVGFSFAFVFGRCGTGTLNFQDNPRGQDLVPPKDHPDDPSRIYVSVKGDVAVGEAGNSTERMGEACVGEEVVFNCSLLFEWGSLCELVDNS